MAGQHPAPSSMPATLEKLGVLSACLALQIVLVTPVPTGREAGGVLTTAAPTPPIGPGRPKDSGPFYCKDVAHQGIPMPGRRLQAAPAPPSPASAAVCTPNPCKNGGTCYALNIFGPSRVIPATRHLLAVFVPEITWGSARRHHAVELRLCRGLQRQRLREAGGPRGDRAVWRCDCHTRKGGAAKGLR